jgi:hypothetical protein
MKQVAIVGAGAAGLAAAYRLDETAVETTVFEKSDVLTGRAATRTRGDVVYDYGANYLKSDDERVNELVAEACADGLVDVDEPIYAFDGEGTVREGRDADDHKWSYREGLHTLGGQLAAATDATVEHDCRVRALERAGEQWAVHLDGERGEPVERGPFDSVLLTPPAPQTAAILQATRWDDDRREALADAAAAVSYRTIYTIVAAYDRAIDPPWYALVNTDGGHEIGWLAREECKPGHVPAGQTVLVIQPAPDWSTAHWDTPVDRVVDEGLALTADLLGDLGGDGWTAPDWTAPEWTDEKGWRYALPNEGLDQNGVAADVTAAGLFVAGDWVAGEARLHAALASGLDAGEAIDATSGQ